VVGSADVEAVANDLGDGDSDGAGGIDVFAGAALPILVLGAACVLGATDGG
jgi:hypothetical protein